MYVVSLPILSISQVVEKLLMIVEQLSQFRVSLQLGNYSYNFSMFPPDLG